MGEFFRVFCEDVRNIILVGFTNRLNLSMKILQIAHSERGGGASRVVFDLHRSYLAAGHDARLLVEIFG